MVRDEFIGALIRMVVVASVFLLLIVFFCLVIWRRLLDKKHASLCERHGFIEWTDSEKVSELITKLLSNKSLDLYLLYEKDGVFVGRCSTTLLGGAGSFEKKLSFYMFPGVNLRPFVLCKRKFEEVLFDQNLLLTEQEVPSLDFLPTLRNLIGEKSNFIICGVDGFVVVLKPSWFFDSHELDVLSNLELESG